MEHREAWSCEGANNADARGLLLHVVFVDVMLLKCC
jgi:hypothetical protein